MTAWIDDKANNRPSCRLADDIEREENGLNARKVAKKLGVSDQAIYRAIERGELHTLLIGGRKVLDPHLTAEWIRSRVA